MKIRQIFLTVLSLCLSLTLTAKETIKVGAIYPLSGNYTRFGDSLRKAVEMKLEELNADESNRYNYEVVYEDDQMNSRLALQAFNKLRDLDKVQAVLTFSAPGAVVAPLCERAQIVQIGCGAAPGIYKGDYNFDHWITLEPVSTMMAKTLQELGMKRIAIVTMRHQSCIAHTDCFEGLAPNYGLEVVFDEKIHGEEKDTRTMLMRIKQANPDIILLNCVNPVGDIFIRQMAELGMDNISVSAITCLYAVERNMLKDIWWVDPSIASDEFYHAFESRWNQTAEVGSANHYDALALIAMACEQWQGEGIPTGEFIAQKLSQVKDYTGALGPTTPTPDGVFDVPSKLVTVTDDFSGYRVLSLEEVKALEKRKAAARQ